MRQYHLDDLVSLTAGTIRRNSSYLSTQLLEPACYYLKWKRRIYVSFEHPAPEYISPPDSPGARGAPNFERLSKSFRPTKWRDRHGLGRHALRFHRVSHLPKTPTQSTAVSVDDPWPAPKIARVVAMRSKDSQPELSHTKRQRTDLALVQSPIRTQRWELTHLECILEPMGSISDDVFVDLVGPHRAAFRETVEQYHGFVQPHADGKMCATFGYPTSMELHPISALHASVEILAKFRQMGVDQPLSARHLRFYICVHTGSAYIRGETSQTTPATIIGTEINEILERLRRVDKPNEVLASEATYRKTEDYYEFQPLEDSAAKDVYTGVYTVVGRKTPLTRSSSPVVLDSSD